MSALVCRCVDLRSSEIPYAGYRRAPLVDASSAAKPFAHAKSECPGCHGTGIEGRARSSNPPSAESAGAP